MYFMNHKMFALKFSLLYNVIIFCYLSKVESFLPYDVEGLTKNRDRL